MATQKKNQANFGPLMRPSARMTLESDAILIISQNRVSISELASMLGVSVPTASRVVAALREKGVGIVSVQDADGRHYRIEGKPDWKSDSLVTGLGCVKRWKGEPSKSEDEIIYDRDP